MKKIVVFADGTGNAFTTQESNVWRLFQAIDQSQPDQIARYIRGVGTSGFRPFAILDGATGIGVPSNVRKLYRFICWNWEPGDEIWLFGFSRGAFTVRTLVGLIKFEGLVPARRRDGSPVSHAEMDRNAMAAWRHYRAETAPRAKTLPTIWAARWIRDRLLDGYRRLRRFDAYDTTRKQTADDGRAEVEIAFLGVFDTVEAFGVPIEELRVAIDKAVWPLSFRNNDLWTGVKQACHALALDDERTTFHPIRFNARAGIEEVWFAGVHSDVGGGYPDAALAYLPLVWMGERAVASGLRFRRGALSGFRRIASPFGPLHDSRAGLGVAYRYDPRHIATDPAPVIHHSVLEKMTLGSERYAPVAMPATALVLMPDGALASLGPPKPKIHPDSTKQLNLAQALDVLPQFRSDTALPVPNGGFLQLTHDTVLLRRIAYFLLLSATLAIVALPWTADAIARFVGRIFVLGGTLVGEPARADAFWRSVVGANGGIASSLDGLSRTIGHVLPSYVSVWLSVLVQHFFTSAAVLLGAWGLYRWNNGLRDAIADHARCAWTAGSSSPAPATETRIVRLARWARHSTFVKAGYTVMARKVLPTIALGAVFVTCIVIASQTLLAYRSGSGDICRASGAKAIVDGKAVILGAFDPRDLCWASGVTLEKGRTYTLWITSTVPFKDGGKDGFPTGLNGFESSKLAFRLGAPLRRRWSAAWFQILARVGDVGGAEQPLIPSDGAEPVDLEDRFDDEVDALCRAERTSGQASPNETTERACRTLTAAERNRLRDRILTERLSRPLVAKLTPQTSGELFLYVNDALFVPPLLPPLKYFYDNNSGKAQVVIQRSESPLPPIDAMPRQE